ncbi:Transcription initiation factor TFIID subunit 1 [Hamiltosporidium tvaerminnensis]|nr:Transcription initiation factor TFIID subunit 1 [Hamiltosporidium tvaerminnensis]
MIVLINKTVLLTVLIHYDPVNDSTNTLHPVNDTTNTLHPVNDSTNEQDPVNDSTNTLHPVNDSTNTLHPVNDSTDTLHPVNDSTNEHDPVNPIPNPLSINNHLIHPKILLGNCKGCNVNYISYYIIGVISKIKEYKQVKPFISKIDKNIWEGYIKVIEYPIWLNKIIKLLRKGYYKSYMHLECHIELIVKNCIKFNGKSSYYGKSVKYMEGVLRKEMYSMFGVSVMSNSKWVRGSK